jgi:flagellar biogenesis protein FliO
MGGIFVLIKIGFVFGLLFVTLRLVGKLYGTGRSIGGGGKHGATNVSVQVLGRQSVGRNADVTVVALGDRTLVLGVTEHNVSVVTELDTEEIVETISIPAIATPALSPAVPARTQATASVPTWRDLLDNLRERTVRR